MNTSEKKLNKKVNDAAYWITGRPPIFTQIQIFMSSPSSANAPKENECSPNNTASASSSFAQDVSEPNRDQDKTEDLSSKTDQAAKLDIKLSPEILLFMKVSAKRNLCRQLFQLMTKMMFQLMTKMMIQKKKKKS